MSCCRWLFKRLGYSVFTISIFSCSVSAATLRWYKPDNPPGHILTGDYAGKGYSDLMQNFLTERLTEYVHQNVVAGYHRATIEMQKDTGCIVGLFPTEERQQYLLFSKVKQLVFSNGLIIAKRHLPLLKPHLNDNGAISIDAVSALASNKLIGGIATSRVYGESIDDFVRHKDSKLIRRSSENVFTGLLQMLLSDRIDYTFGYPVELAYATSTQKMPEAFVFVPIIEMPEYQTSHIACSNDPIGKQVIDRINQILTEYRHKPEVIEMYSTWLEEGLANRFKTLSADYFSLHIGS